MSIVAGERERQVDIALGGGFFASDGKVSFILFA
jgi:hypothetical protein